MKLCLHALYKFTRKLNVTDEGELDRNSEFLAKYSDSIADGLVTFFTLRSKRDVLKLAGLFNDSSVIRKKYCSITLIPPIECMHDNDGGEFVNQLKQVLREGAHKSGLKEADLSSPAQNFPLSNKTLVHRQGVSVKLIDCKIILSLV
jgi:hypothetical protein